MLLSFWRSTRRQRDESEWAWQACYLNGKMLQSKVNKRPIEDAFSHAPISIQFTLFEHKKRTPLLNEFVTDD